MADAPEPIAEVEPVAIHQGLSDFWLVWADNGRASVRVHLKEEYAIREAKRLAVKVPGKRFHVLHAYTSFKTPKAEPPAIDPEFLEAT